MLFLSLSLSLSILSLVLIFEQTYPDPREGQKLLVNIYEMCILVLTRKIKDRHA